MPAHNAAETLAETLDSIRRQTRPDWVAHVVDDGSTDATAEIAESYVRVDGRFQVSRVRAGGVCAASNFGAARASTPWLAFLHADDLYRAEFLGDMLHAADRAPEQARALVYADCQHMAADGRLGRIERAPRDQHAQYLCTACIFYTCAVIVAREIFEVAGGYDESLRTAEDWDLYVRLLASGAQPVGVHRPLAIYRLRPGSLARTYDRMFHDARTVIHRAYGARSIVPDPGQVDRSVCLVGLWHLGVSIGAGRAECEFMTELPVVPDLSPADAAEHLVLGIAAGACQIPEDWPGLWARFGEAIARQLEHLGDRRDAVLAALRARATGDPE